MEHFGIIFFSISYTILLLMFISFDKLIAHSIKKGMEQGLEKGFKELEESIKKLIKS